MTFVAVVKVPAGIAAAADSRVVAVPVGALAARGAGAFSTDTARKLAVVDNTIVFGGGLVEGRPVHMYAPPRDPGQPLGDWCREFSETLLKKQQNAGESGPFRFKVLVAGFDDGDLDGQVWRWETGSTLPQLRAAGPNPHLELFGGCAPVERLLLGAPRNFGTALVHRLRRDHGVDLDGAAVSGLAGMVASIATPPRFAEFTLDDAEAFARWLASVAVGASRFLDMEAVCGGAVRSAVVTPQGPQR